MNTPAHAESILLYTLAISYLAIVLVALYKVLYVPNLSKLLCEPDGKASISRFQLFVFTLVISGLYLALSIEAGQLIDVPNGALTLLGISGGSFLISKGIKPGDGGNTGGNDQAGGQGGNPQGGQGGAAQ
ncbi:hypothetical protein [Chitinimonas sp.]|uniref:hypothetical protein n=1 Tax=Chitinimonas sp. TaxID=1934313 RepID=UPI002F91F66D